jgi:hypothetical protein
MTLDFYIDLELRKLIAGPDNTSSPKLPPLTQGDEYTVALHFLQTVGPAGNRSLREIRPAFTSLKIGIGWVDRPPTSGTWRITCGANTSAPLGHAITKQALATALNALASVTALGGITVEAAGAANIFQIRWNDPDVVAGSAVLTVSDNRLAPKSFSRVSRYSTDRGWLHIVKIFQSPIAFTDQFIFPVPPGSTCSLVRTGTGARNAVAELRIPDGAVGSLDLVWSGLDTVILPVSSITSARIATALNDLYTDGVARFAVSNPRRGVYYIEYVGPLGLAPQPAPTVNLHDQESLPYPVGTLSLDVPGAELALDGAPSVRGLTLEAAMLVDGSEVTLFQQPITLFNDMLDEEMATAADPVWLAELAKPTATVDYDPESTVIGMLGYQDFAGDAVASVWTYAHNLSTLNLHITVRDNVSGVRVPDNEYLAEILNANQVRITFSTPPAVDRYVVVISAANADSHYNPHEHAIAQITGLQAALNALSAAGNPLELWPEIPLDKLPAIPAAKLVAEPLPDALIPQNIPRLDPAGYLPLASIPPEVPRLLPDGSVVLSTRVDGSTPARTVTLVAASGTVPPELLGDLSRVPGFVDAIKAVLSGGGASAAALSFALPQYSELYPGRVQAPLDISTIDPATLPRPGGLLPAVHDAVVEDYEEGPNELPPPPSVGGQVFENVTFNNIALPGGLGRRGSVWKPGEFAASDGRVLYRVVREGTTTTYHPEDFARELLLVDVNASMFPAGSIFTLLFDFEAQVLRSETRAQWVVIVEHGSFASVASPAGRNISAITWAATPMITCPIHLTAVRTPHVFGVRITRTGDALATQTKLYRGAWTTSANGPSAAGYAVRARLARFDTEDGLPDARGYIALALNPTKQSLATIV